MKYDKLLEQKIIANIDEKYKQFHSQLVPNTLVRGVRIPTLRKIAKEFCKYDDFLQNITLDNYEAVSVACYYIGLTTKDVKKLNRNLQIVLPHINNWAICDTFVSSLKILKTKKAEFLDTIQQCLNSQKEFEVRFAIVCLLSYYIEDVDTKFLFDKMISLQNKSYYIDMAIAWLVSVAFVKRKEETLKLLQNKKLVANVQNTSISKICDSFRVSKDDKLLVKKLRL